MLCRFGYSESAMGLVLAAFFVGYASTQARHQSEAADRRRAIRIELCHERVC